MKEIFHLLLWFSLAIFLVVTKTRLVISESLSQKIVSHNLFMSGFGQSAIIVVEKTFYIHILYTGGSLVLVDAQKVPSNFQKQSTSI